MKRIQKSWMFNDSKWEGSACRNVIFHVFMAGAIQVVVCWLWHPLLCRWIPMFYSNTLSTWTIISWASPLLNSHPMCPWKGLFFTLYVLSRWCSLPYFDLPLNLAINRVVFSKCFMSRPHKHWGPEKGPFYFLVVYFHHFISLDHFQSSFPTFSGFDWPLVCIYTIIISYPYSTHLAPKMETVCSSTVLYFTSWYHEP